jgi:YfiH family protein
MILPRPDAAFEWRQVDGLPVLVCPRLSTIAQHAFTTKDWELGSRERSARESGWDQIARSLGVDPRDLLRARQVHGVQVADCFMEGGRLPEADVVVGNGFDTALAVQVADCAPILIADERTGAVAAIHAGWRGLAGGAPLAGVTALTERFGSRPANLVAAIGPSIGACCYQVGPDVRDAFIVSGYPASTIRRWFCDEPVAMAHNPAMPGLERTRRADRWFFDGWTAAVTQLLDGGLRAERIFAARLCTASHPARFCSFRRDGSATGRQIGAIRTRPLRPSPD